VSTHSYKHFSKHPEYIVKVDEMEKYIIMILPQQNQRKEELVSLAVIKRQRY